MAAGSTICPFDEMVVFTDVRYRSCIAFRNGSRYEANRHQLEDFLRVTGRRSTYGVLARTLPRFPWRLNDVERIEGILQLLVQRPARLEAALWRDSRPRRDREPRRSEIEARRRRNRLHLRKAESHRGQLHGTQLPSEQY